MRRYDFNCTLLADIVLNSGTATEGSADCLDFIPGSNFLGIAAREYEALQKEGIAYNVFHGGGIRFGDAHPFQEGLRARRVPACWFYRKGSSLEEEPAWVSHLVTESELKRLENEGTQLKQARSGFFFEDGALIRIEKYFSLKSAQNRETRRAEDGKLFGYSALRRGSIWRFSIDCDNEDAGERIASLVVGVHHIGRSRSAQYGTVEIVLVGSNDFAGDELISGEVVLYADSRWVLHNAHGRATVVPSSVALGLPAGSEVLWEKCQIRRFCYAPWNHKRNCRDADRVCVEKGSVVVVNLSEPLPEQHFLKGIGSYKAEGFGSVVANPSFLDANEAGRSVVTIRNCQHKLIHNSGVRESDQSDLLLEEWLSSRRNVLETEERILRDANNFANTYGGHFKSLTASQWGQIRSRASRAVSNEELHRLLFEEPSKTGKQGKELSGDRHHSGLLVHGKTAKAWAKNAEGLELRKILEAELCSEAKREYGPIYAVRLAAVMQAMIKRNENKRSNS
jgi:hypothetical protein